MSAPHILVVTVDPDDSEHQLYEIECPGVTDTCRAWIECGQEHDEDAQEEIAENGELHGLQHQANGPYYSVPVEPAECYLPSAETLGDVAGDLELAPGKYPIEAEYGDENELVGLCVLTGFDR